MNRHRSYAGLVALLVLGVLLPFWPEITHAAAADTVRSDAADPLDHVMDVEQSARLHTAVEALPVDQRQVVALRFFNIYGPRQALSNPYTGVLAIFASRLLNDKPPVIFEDGRQCRRKQQLELCRRIRRREDALE